MEFAQQGSTQDNLACVLLGDEVHKAEQLAGALLDKVLEFIGPDTAGASDG